MPQPDFAAHLRKQLGFLARSCQAFDAGNHDEAIRIATVVRVLIHQTKNCTSLLKHLGATTINLLTTSKGATPNTLMLFSMGTIAIQGDGRNDYSPTLDDSPYKDFVPVSKWWDQIVLVQNNMRLSRRKIVLGAADQDGGAHVDAKLNAEYYALTQAGFVGSVSNFSNTKHSAHPLENTHFVCLRQIGYELLNSPELLRISDS